MNNKITALVALLALNFVVVMPTVNAASLNEKLMQCAVLKDSLERLHCFDQLTLAAKTAPAEAYRAPVATASVVTPVVNTATPTATVAPTITTVAPTATKPQTPEDQFGIEHKRTAEQEATDKLTFIIDKASKDLRDHWTLIFTNGQKWKQTDSTDVRFSSGDKVIISRGVFNSFNLRKAGSNRSLKVKRLN